MNHVNQFKTTSTQIHFIASKMVNRKTSADSGMLNLTSAINLPGRVKRSLLYQISTREDPD
jgi:hypothetical protein